jgi:hypothetical protein
VAELSDALGTATADIGAFAAFSERTLGEQLGAWGSYFGDLAGLVGSGNEKILAASKAFGAAEALVNAWRGYSQVIGDPKIDPLLKFAAAGKVLAAGIGAVNAIKSIGKGGTGGRSSGGGGGGGGRVARAADLPTQTIRLTASDALTEAFARQLLPALNAAAQNGGRIKFTS